MLVERIEHHFRTYKIVPGQETQITIQKAYGVEHACKVIQVSMADCHTLVDAPAAEKILSRRRAACFRRFK